MMPIFLGPIYENYIFLNCTYMFGPLKYEINKFPDFKPNFE